MQLTESDFDAYPWCAPSPTKSNDNSFQLDERDVTKARRAEFTNNFCAASTAFVLETQDSPGPRNVCGSLSYLSGSGPDASHRLQVDAAMPLPSFAPHTVSPPSVVEQLEFGASHPRHIGPLQTLVDHANTFGQDSSKKVNTRSSRKENLSKSSVGPSSSRKESENILSTRRQGLHQAPVSSAGQLFFDKNMLPATPRKLRKKTKAELKAFRTLRKSGGACPEHKAARKAVICTSDHASF